MQWQQTSTLFILLIKVSIFILKLIFNVNGYQQGWDHCSVFVVDFQFSIDLAISKITTFDGDISASMIQS